LHFATDRPQIARSGLSSRDVEGFRHGVKIIREQVAVPIQRQSRLLMAQQLLHHRDVPPT
jgi:hypothetical protein